MRIWGDENPHETVEAPKSREKVTVFVAIGANAGLIGPYFFQDDSGKAETIKTANYLKMLQMKMIPALKRKKLFESCIFQQDGAPAHCSKEAIEWLTEKFGEERLISRNSSFAWPPYSPDLNPRDFFLWGYLKSKVYTSPYPKTAEELKRNIVRECRKITKEVIQSAVNLTIYKARRYIFIYIYIYPHHFTDTTASTLTRVSAKTVQDIKLKLF